MCGPRIRTSPFCPNKCDSAASSPHSDWKSDKYSFKGSVMTTSGEANIQLYLTFHSYGQYLLYPWGNDKLDTRDWQELKHVGDVANNAMRRLNHGVSYQVGSAAKMLYPASGGSDDWAKGAAGIKY